MAHATVDDYFTDNGEVVPPDLTDAERARITGLLEDATDQVDGYVRLARYATDSTGRATDAGVLRALRRATVKQARYFDENPSSLSESVPQYDSISAGSLTLSNRASSTTAGRTSPNSEKAYAILLGAGLFSTVVRH